MVRKLWLVAMVATAGLVATHSGRALADYVWPGRIIIGYGNGGGGTTTNAAMLEECVLVAPVECECFPFKTVLDACLASGAKIQCLTPEAEFLSVEQPEPVVLGGESGTLASLKCGDQSKATAFIRLPYPK